MDSNGHRPRSQDPVMRRAGQVFAVLVLIVGAVIVVSLGIWAVDSIWEAIRR